MPNYRIGIELEADDNASGNIKKVTSAAGSLDDAFAKSNAGAGGLGASLASMVNPATLATGAAAALGAALVATGAHAMDLANQVEVSAAKMDTELGLTTEQADEFEETMRSIYANNYGESFEDIAASLVVAEQGFARIGGVGQEELQAITEQALAFRDAFGTDVQETIGATATLMENFGLTSGEAMDFLVAAQQRGLNSSGDLLDTIGEYSVQFSEGGASADEFFAILEKGNAGGVLGTDKIADAYKEFGIRIKDDSATTKTALADIGISYETLRAGFADGSIDVSTAMQMVIDKINAIEDPVERAKAGVALFGTQWEDSGESAILALGDLEEALVDTEGAAESLGDQYNTTAGEISNATRAWDAALVDVGEELNNLWESVLPALAWSLENILVPALKFVTDYFHDLGEGIEKIQGWIDALRGIAPEPATSSAFAGGGSSLPVATPTAQAQMLGGGTVNHIQVYVERGDFETVQAATEIGVGQAQRKRGE